MINVFVSGVGGFPFWIIAARSAEPAVVAQASAMITSILGVTTLSQQSLVVNVPILIAGSPRPRRARRTRIRRARSALTAFSAFVYLIFGTRIASGLAYLRDLRLAMVFVSRLRDVVDLFAPGCGAHRSTTRKAGAAGEHHVGKPSAALRLRRCR